MEIKKLLALLILPVVGFGAQAQTQTLTFDGAGAVTQEYASSYYGIGDTYTQGIFTLTTGAGNHFDSMDVSGLYFHNGSANANYDNWARLTSSTGTFDLSAFTFNNVGGEVRTNLNGATQTFSTGVQTVNLSGVTWVEFSAIGNGASDYNEIYLDNVTVAAVPVPETYAMLLAGLGLIGAIARRRRDAKALQS